MIIVKCFPAHDEPGMCRTGLVSPYHSLKTLADALQLLLLLVRLPWHCIDHCFGQETAHLHKIPAWCFFFFLFLDSGFWRVWLGGLSPAALKHIGQLNLASSLVRDSVTVRRNMSPPLSLDLVSFTMADTSCLKVDKLPWLQASHERSRSSYNLGLPVWNSLFSLTVLETCCAILWVWVWWRNL